MESIWTGASEDAFFNPEAFTRNRILKSPEYEAQSTKSTKLGYYVIGVDVGRRGCASEAVIIHVEPQQHGPSLKKIVNIYELSNEHFEDQAIELKMLYYKYNARRLVIDGNGLGIGLIDYMVKPHVSYETGDTLKDFGVYNDTENFYKKFQTPKCEHDAIYIIKANATINTEAHVTFQSDLNSGKLKFLIDERVARDELLQTKRGQVMSPEERADFLKPFTLTSLLQEELGNLRQENEGTNIFLKQNNKRIPKDIFSALEYALYYIKTEEDSKKKKKKFVASEWMFMN